MGGVLSTNLGARPLTQEGFYGILMDKGTLKRKKKRAKWQLRLSICNNKKLVLSTDEPFIIHFYFVLVKLY